MIEERLLNNNIIIISGEINEESVKNYQSCLIFLMTKLSPKETLENPITIYINSDGGFVYDGIGLIDLMDHMKSKGYIIRTINSGKCCSMASYILMSGTKGYRESFPNASVMLHELYHEDSGKLSELKDSLRNLNRLQEILNRIINKNSLYDTNYMKRIDHWLSAQEALNYKIIDKIL